MGPSALAFVAEVLKSMCVAMCSGGCLTSARIAIPPEADVSSAATAAAAAAIATAAVTANVAVASLLGSTYSPRWVPPPTTSKDYGFQCP